MATIINGVTTAQEVKDEIAEKVAIIRDNGGKIPHLAAILVGDDGASQAYVGGKVKACEYVGFKSTLKTFDAETSEEELLQVIDQLNDDPDIDGYIVQLPLPKHLSARKVTERILPEKDVDGFHPVNVGRMVKGLPAYVAATPYGIMQLLERYEIETEGKHCVVILITHSLPSNTAVVALLAASEPALASVKPKPQSASPLQSFGKYFFFWASSPK